MTKDGRSRDMNPHTLNEGGDFWRLDGHGRAFEGATSNRERHETSNRLARCGRWLKRRAHNGRRRHRRRLVRLGSHRPPERGRRYVDEHFERARRPFELGPPAHRGHYPAKAALEHLRGAATRPCRGGGARRRRLRVDGVGRLRG